MTDKVQIGDATLYLGDCREVLKGIVDASIDAIVTDPPYELGFMGRDWDRSGVANDVAVWTECLRVLKPGGHLLAFSGSRTYHRMACAIEDAGFELRDQIMWIYGSGFPKSRNLGGDWNGWGTALKPAHEPICVARKPLVGTVAENVLVHGTGALNIDACRVPTDDKLGGGAEKETTVDQKGNEGWTRPWMSDEAARSAHAERVRGNVEKAEMLGRWPANVIHDGSDEVLAAFAQFGERGAAAPVKGTEASAASVGRVTGARDRVPGAFHGDAGTAARFFYNTQSGSICDANTAAQISFQLNQADAFAQNLAAIAALRADKPLSGLIRRFMNDMASALHLSDAPNTRAIQSIEQKCLHELLHISTLEKTENHANPADALALISTTTIIQSLSNIAGSADNATSGTIATILEHGVRACDPTLRSRFMYCAKASRADRNEGCEHMARKPLHWSSGDANPGAFQPEGTDKTSQNNHPTVKPTDLMAYLVRLVTPPGGTVLDPFMGSGSTGKAAVREGLQFIGIDVTPEYVEISRVRIAYELDRINREREAAARQGSLFELA
ncbi:hypothetical protein WK91_18535 [Burkholderia cepacia]|uniref:site-specific DNA-methyltransferase n=1 Tax=Burkholderia cepacia TaxID=292 RepID=UPI000759979C|nr:site-specific DNA-methyltransferase [Burkholderia cepacia]KVW15434.1 hypothetical protein WK91_18535 [Burkholderia cepacia]